ncbi:RnfABCDGE type electron transport complex subunit D, partial [Vibrio cincinnatiensis]
MGLKKFLEDIEPHFEPGGKHEKWFALYEAAATLFYTPGTVTKKSSHVRDSVDLKRIMIMVWFAVFPAMFWGMYNAGGQAILALQQMAISGQIDLATTIAGNWHYWLTESVGGNIASAGWGTKMLLGATYFLPIYA